MADLAQKATDPTVTKIFVKFKFSDFTRTTVERAGLRRRWRISDAAGRRICPDRQDVRLLGVGVRFAPLELARGGSDCRCCSRGL